MDADGEHEHRWIVQDEDDPPNTYLVCIQCGEVIEPTGYIAMLEIIKYLAAEIPDWHDSEHLHHEAVTLLKRLGRG